jgi:excisionase family DNA binding protein
MTGRMVLRLNVRANHHAEGRYRQKKEVSMPVVGTKQTKQLEPLVVKPREACQLLSCGRTHLWGLIKAGKLEAFSDGRSCKITVASIRCYIDQGCSLQAALST